MKKYYLAVPFRDFRPAAALIFYIMSASLQKRLYHLFIFSALEFHNRLSLDLVKEELMLMIPIKSNREYPKLQREMHLPRLKLALFDSVRSSSDKATFATSNPKRYSC